MAHTAAMVAWAPADPSFGRSRPFHLRRQERLRSTREALHRGGLIDPIGLVAAYSFGVYFTVNSTLRGSP